MSPTAPHAAAATPEPPPCFGGHDPHTLTEGAPIQVRWARLGTPGEVGEVWCPGTYLGTVGRGAEKRYLVRSATPRSAGPVVLPAAPESVRFVAAVAQ